MLKQKIVILSGAGVSAESGISTFRDKDGLWEGYDVMTVASPQGWKQDQELVLDFYNQRRRQLIDVQPNHAHKAFAEMQKDHTIIHITQNVDDLLERAGNTEVIHLHGELRKARSTAFEEYVIEWKDDLNTGDLCPQGHQLRPHIVWFGEAVPLLDKAISIVQSADIIVIVGTSMQVYPAASLVGFAKKNIPIYYIDPNPQLNHELNIQNNLTVIKEKATVGVEVLKQKLLEG